MYNEPPDKKDDNSEEYCFVGCIHKVNISELHKLQCILENLPDEVQTVFKTISMNYLYIKEKRAEEVF